LHRFLAETPRPQFDYCYIDGAHTWDGTSLSFLLVDLLLKPGGWVVFDDLNWSISKSQAAKKNMQRYAEYSDEEKRFGWGIAQKPA